MVTLTPAYPGIGQGYDAGSKIRRASDAGHVNRETRAAYPGIGQGVGTSGDQILLLSNAEEGTWIEKWKSPQQLT